MEQNPQDLESDAFRALRPIASPQRRTRRWYLILPTFSAVLISMDSTAASGNDAATSAAAQIVYGSDMEGGGPYIFPDPKNPRQVTGFEVELMELLGRELRARPVFAQGQWDNLLQILATRRVDMVINGYEWTEARARDFLASRPYYVFQLQLMAPRKGLIRSWNDVTRPKPDGGRWRIGVLGGSAAENFANDHGGRTVEVVSYTGATDAMLSVVNGQLDGTLQDLPAARFYLNQYPSLENVGPPEGKGYYVIYMRRDSARLRDAVDTAIAHFAADGSLRNLYERYGIWTDAQTELASWTPASLRSSSGQETLRGWRLVAKYGELLASAAGMTIVLSGVSMPIAMTIGLLVALARLYGPPPLRWLGTAYVEALRGTPLMLQLFVLYYVVKLPALAAAIGGLAINYSAYEAEIYRAGLQAIPAGQMEAALALGMSRRLALRRIIVPQAVRIVIPPVTNDFIALFKDTSVCSVITVIELSKRYQILANSTGGVVEFALATAALYLAMSLPLSWFSNWSERRLDANGEKGGAPA
jgi:polar amino acid transport system substrate-binding protein